jgi:hypothetical protein
MISMRTMSRFGFRIMAPPPPPTALGTAMEVYVYQITQTIGKFLRKYFFHVMRIKYMNTGEHWKYPRSQSNLCRLSMIQVSPSPDCTDL